MSSTAPDRRRYVIRHSDQYLYYLDKADFGSRASSIEELSLRADDTPMACLEAKNYHGGWFAADHRAGQILVQDPATKVPTGYALRDPEMESAKYPLTFTPMQWQERAGDSDRWQYYETEYRDEPAHWVALAVDTGDWLEIDGTPPPPATDDSLAWVPDLLPGLMERPEFYHVMPGRIPGLTECVAKRLKAILGQFSVSYDHQGRDPGMTVRLQVPFERPITRWQPNIGRTGNKLKSGKTVETTVTREMRLPVPLNVPGENYAEALAAWNQAIEFWVGVVQSSAAGAARACNQCGGHGFVGGDVHSEYDAPKDAS